jgi:hypothetical protein
MTNIYTYKVSKKEYPRPSSTTISGRSKIKVTPTAFRLQDGLPTGALRAVVNLRLFAVPVTCTNEASSAPEQPGKDSTNAQERQPWRPQRKNQEPIRRVSHSSAHGTPPTHRLRCREFRILQSSLLLQSPHRTRPPCSETPLPFSLTQFTTSQNNRTKDTEDEDEDEEDHAARQPTHPEKQSEAENSTSVEHR